MHFFVLLNSAAKVNNQLFDTQEALDLHLKYLHDPKKANPNVEEWQQYSTGILVDLRRRNEVVAIHDSISCDVTRLTVTAEG